MGPRVEGPPGLVPWTLNSPPLVSVGSIEVVRVAFRELAMFEVREVLRLWLDGRGYRVIAGLVRPDRKTVTRMVEGWRARAPSLCTSTRP